MKRTKIYLSKQINREIFPETLNLEDYQVKKLKDILIEYLNEKNNIKAYLSFAEEILEIIDEYEEIRYI